MSDLAPTERIGGIVGGRYRLDAVIGVGGMGVVYLGAHAWTGREVAVKVLWPELSNERELVGRFMQEARAATQLSHPNVVQVYDMGADPDGTVYMVLELLRGETLRARLQRAGRLSPQETLDSIAPVMGALATAHASGIVHRDVKPDNVFLSVRSGDRVVPTLLDFGVAKLARPDIVERTRAGLVLGTPAYMSPEQALGLPSVGPASDVWSIGVVLYQCLSGELPFDGVTPALVLLAVTTERAAPLATRVSLPERLCAVIDRSLEPDPARRHAGMEAMLGELDAAARAIGLESPEVAVLPPRSMTQGNHPSMVGAPLTVVLAGAAPPRDARSDGEPSAADGSPLTPRSPWNGDSTAGVPPTGRYVRRPARGSDPGSGRRAASDEHPTVARPSSDEHPTIVQRSAPQPDAEQAPDAEAEVRVEESADEIDVVVEPDVRTGSQPVGNPPFEPGGNPPFEPGGNPLFEPVENPPFEPGVNPAFVRPPQHAHPAAVPAPALPTVRLEPGEVVLGGVPSAQTWVPGLAARPSAPSVRAPWSIGKILVVGGAIAAIVAAATAGLLALLIPASRPAAPRPPVVAPRPAPAPSPKAGGSASAPARSGAQPVEALRAAAGSR